MLILIWLHIQKYSDWPPPAGIDVLSISGINYSSSKQEDLRWYWAPATATWIYTIFIAYFLYRASCDYIDMRQQFFRDPPNQVSAKSLLVTSVPKEARSDSKLKSWLAGMKGVIQHPIEQAIIGHHSAKLNKLTVEHEEAVRNLENTLAFYLEGKNKGGFNFHISGNGVDTLFRWERQEQETSDGQSWWLPWLRGSQA